MARRDYTTVDGTVMSVQYVTAAATPTVSGDGNTATPAGASQTQSYPTDGSSNSSDGSSSPTATANPAPSYTAGTITSDSVPSSSTGTEMSIGGKIGVALVIILVIGGVLGVALFYKSRKDRQAKAEQARQDAEKDAAAIAARQEVFVKRQNEDAPQLTLRPASSFLPDLLGGGKRRSRLSLGLSSLLGTTSETNPARAQYLAAIGKDADIQMSEKSPTVENPFCDPENPFADPVKAAGSTTVSDSKPKSTSSSSSSSTLSLSSPSHAAVIETKDPADSAPEVVHISGEQVQPIPTKEKQHEPVEMPSEPVIAPVHIPAPAPAPVQPPRSPISPTSNNEGNVYRILMDFNPSMPDELELKGGQVVRMLHEYDDGWCLATRLDRSQQGVVPRTCLAAKPSKPRPQQESRSSSPAMRMASPTGRPMSPAGLSRPAAAQLSISTSPANQPLSPGAYNQSPRPLSPRVQTKRSMSPAPIAPPQIDVNQRRRSKSSSARAVQDRRASPPGPSKLGPGAGVPGMAI